MTNSQTGKADSAETMELDQQTIAIGQRSAKQPGVQLEPGSTILERYQIVELLGRGGMGSVYHVRHLHLQTDYALKVLDAQANESNWRRFDNEARAASRLDHPNLIKVYDSGLLDDGQPFFIMELVRGSTLADVLKKRGRLTLSQALSVSIQIGFALAYAHDQGVIHRDLKPSNIMLVENSSGSIFSSVRVVDLGIAKLTGVDEYNQQTLTRTGEIFGSPLYMSPEQCMGVTVDKRADLYSLGCMLYEALTGAPPLIGDNALSTMMKHQSEKPLSLKEASLGIAFPQAVEDLVAKLLQKDPSKRFANAQLLTAALVSIQQALQETSAVQESSEPVSILNDGQKRESLLNALNPLSILLIVSAFGLGFFCGNWNMIHSDPGVKPQENIPLTQMKEDSKSIPSEIIDVAEGKSLPGTDPYMGTGKSYFSKPIGKDLVRWNFPPYESVGEIGFRTETRGDYFVRIAKGEFDLPKGRVAFRADKRLFLYPKLLEKFHPGELVSLELKDAQRDAKQLLQILPNQQNLVSLHLGNTLVSNADLRQIGKLPKLQELFLGGSFVATGTVEAMPNLNKLINLDISLAKDVSGVLKKLTENKSLRALRLKGCNITENDLKVIGRMHGLINLDVNDNPAVNDKTLVHILSLKNLRSLNLERCKITPACAETLKQFPAIIVYVSTAQFNEQAIAGLQKSLPNAKIELRSGDQDSEYHRFLDESMRTP